MIFQARWQVFYWVILLGCLMAILLATIDRAAQTGLLGWAAMALLGLLFVFGLLWILVQDRSAFVSTVLYLLGAFVVLGIGESLIETGEPLGIAAGLGSIVLYTAPGLCVLAIVLLSSYMPLRALLGGKKRDYYRGLKHLTKERYEEAVAALSRYQQEHPEDPRGWEWLVMSLLNARRFEEALERANRALQLKRTPEGLLNRGRSLLTLGATEEALSDIEAALELKPHLPLGQTVLAVALIRLRRLDDALRALRRERGLYKSSVHFLTLGDAHRLRRRSDLAFKAYKEATKRAARELKAGFTATEGMMAYTLAEQAKLEQAEKTVRSRLSQDPSDIVALSAQALIQRQRGDHDGVEATLQRILTVSPQAVIDDLADADFTALLVEERFRRLLGRALDERDRILERARSRAQSDPGDGAPGFQPV
jgi:tetratricopeptide (TPR) repeat protein